MNRRQKNKQTEVHNLIGRGNERTVVPSHCTFTSLIVTDGITDARLLTTPVTP